MLKCLKRDKNPLICKTSHTLIVPLQGSTNNIYAEFIYTCCIGVT